MSLLSTIEMEVEALDVLIVIVLLHIYYWLLLCLRIEKDPMANQDLNSSHVMVISVPDF